MRALRPEGIRPMTIRERILAVYRGQAPDVVPFMLDLSHWFYHRNRLPWDLSQAYDKPECALIDCHKQVGAGFYLPNLGAFYTVEYGDDVETEVVKDRRSGTEEITWRLATPRGRIERKRVWEERSYSWAISKWGVEGENDLRVLGDALGGRRYSPRWDRYKAWADAVGDTGVVYLPAGYSAMGHLLHYWMGVTRVAYAAHDWAVAMRDAVDQINASNLRLVDLLCTSPAEIVLMGDNFSSNIQPPHFFDEWSRPYYVEAVRRLHAAGKAVAVHVDGTLRGALGMIRETGADCADAVTPTPMGDLTPTECRREAGPDFILSGGVAPNLWLPGADVDAFKSAVLAWLDLKRLGPRLIAAAGDQVPPGATVHCIEIMRDLVEQQGRY
ncbi:MAG: hypothetical protein JSV65_11310 [Armatimonadota bacterium]|nr:MAG: hypothetical protein JSV65_11310 [Armatimonadota bacterium]